MQLLNLIRVVGAAAPSELAVKTFRLPEEADQILNKLGEKGLITSQQVKSTASPQLVRLTDLGLRVARFEVLKRMVVTPPWIARCFCRTSTRWPLTCSSLRSAPRSLSRNSYSI